MCGGFWAACQSNSTAYLYTLSTAVIWLALCRALGALNVCERHISRKLTHIGTGLLYILTWPAYDDSPWAPYLCSSVVLCATIQFVLVGLGVLNDQALVNSAARTGKRGELLWGPLFYGSAHVVFTVLFWRTSTLAIVGLAVLCAGDGLAEIVGKAYGSGKNAKLPHNRSKSYAGSLGCFLGGTVAAASLLLWFTHLGLLARPVSPAEAFTKCAVCSLVGTAVESLPLAEIDNWTMTISSALTAWLLFGF